VCVLRTPSHDIDPFTYLRDILRRPPIHAADQREELLPDIWFATTFLDGWTGRAFASAIKALEQMAKTLAAHRSGLLPYYARR
jgi:hypothetical protein